MITMIIFFTTSALGVDCVIVKSGRRICGTGAALANAPLVQDKSYFEAKVQCEGSLLSIAVDNCVSEITF